MDFIMNLSIKIDANKIKNQGVLEVSMKKLSNVLWICKHAKISKISFNTFELIFNPCRWCNPDSG